MPIVRDHDERAIVAVEKLLHGEFILERVVALLGELLDHADEQADVRLFQQRIRLPALVGKVGMLSLPAREQILPARLCILGGGARLVEQLLLHGEELRQRVALVGGAFALHLDQLAQEIVGGVAGLRA